MRTSLVLLIAAALAASAACDLQKTGSQLSARSVMVGTILSTPPVDLKPAAFGSTDGGFPFDGGLPPDAGFFLDGGTVTLPGQTLAFVFFGTRTSESLDSAPAGVAGATITVGAVGGAIATLKDDGSGSYSKSSLDDGTFQYESGQTYDFTATSAGAEFVGEVKSAPALEKISQFHPASGFISATANSSFTFTRPDPPSGQERNLGFVSVYPIDSQGQKAEPTYSNVPKTPVEFLKLIALPSEWKKTEVVVPAEAFPQPGQTYAVVFQAVKVGGPKSDNLFTGSALLAGTADVGVVRTR